MQVILNLISQLGYLNIIPIVVIFVVAHFLIKGLEMIFKILAYILVIFVVYYFFGDIIFNLIAKII